MISVGCPEPSHPNELSVPLLPDPQEQVIGQMAEERQVWLDQLIAQSREIGRLETQVQQLAAPQRDTSRHDATAVVLLDATAAEPEQTVIDSATQADPEPPTRSVWRRIFG